MALFLFGMTHPILSQEACDFIPSSKAEKLLEQAKDRKKYDSQKRRGFYEKVLEDDENCLPCLHKLGVSEFKIAKTSGLGFNTSLNYLEKLVEKCPEYHSDPYYYLGAINYANQEYDKAYEYFDKYLHFPDDDEEKFQRDYEKKYAEVEETLPYVEFWKDFHKNDGPFEPELVEGVCTGNGEYLPALSHDSEVIFYTRKSSKKAKGDFVTTQVEEITWSKRDDVNGIFDEGEPLPKPFNLGTNYGGASLSVDNKELFFAAKNPVSGNPDNFDIFVSNYKRTYDDAKGEYVYEWSDPENLGENINTDMAWESQPTLSGDGKTLYFCTISETTTPSVSGNNPTHDIYFSERQEDGSWSKAKSVGPTINTSFQEKTPFMHSDSHTLYFSSDRQPGGGDLDMWYVKKKDDGTWGEPKNLGAPINTNGREEGMVVSSDGELAYYSARIPRKTNGYDILSFPLPEEAKPEAVVILKGRMSNENGTPPPPTKIEIEYVQSKEVQSIAVNEDDGTYAGIIRVDKGEDVIMRVQNENDQFDSHLIVDQDDKEQPVVVELDIVDEPVKKGKPFIIPDIRYSTNSADINRGSKLILDDFAKYLIDHPSMYVQILGHTDSQGKDSDNLALSMDRAFEVKGYLESLGVEGKRITAEGKGETSPLQSNDTEEGRAKNRRTEFLITRL